MLKFTLPCADVIRQSKKCAQTEKEESNFTEARFGWMGQKSYTCSISEEHC